MKYEEIKKITILGIGGKASYYIAKFLNHLGVDVVGYDLKKTDRTEELEKLGIEINYRNPEKGESFDTKIFLYSNDLPKVLQNQIRKDNEDLKAIEIGEFYRQIIKVFQSESMSDREIEAFHNSEIAPLFSIDTRKTRYIAVTGTDGKTTTCTMIYHLLKGSGFKPALITTVAAYIGDEQIDTGLHTTTPSSQEMYEIIKKIENENCTHIIIEATSHGLQQGRLAGLKFDTVGYTNITSEHLDYHGDWNSYCNAKSLLIKEHLKDGGKVVLNLDDNSYEILSELTVKPIVYSLEKPSDFQAQKVEEKENKVFFELIHNDKTYESEIPILGKYNVSNFLCALAICHVEGLQLKNMIKSIHSFKTVQGRMEVLQSTPFYVIVDYAHTSNATKVALESARSLLGENGKLIHVFGCAGQRDFYKRFDMGRFSNELADISILTAEDPRLEDLRIINDEIERGWKSGNSRNSQLYRFDYMDRDVQVRRDAIAKALEIANQGDVVIVTGKAHEQSLCFNQTEFPWNDIEEVKLFL
jgi:UDP-N-acetylmuramoyl-L-alanyl-D-glutamate--2,6-diaminopimelate ligase